MNVKRADREYLVSDSREDLQVVRSEGSCIFDERGRRYIDFLTGWNVGNFGWGSEEIREAIRNSESPEYIYPRYLYAPWVELARLLADLTPGKLKMSFRATGGTEAVETALQVAMAYTKRGKFVSIEDSYHGNSIATLSIGSSDNKDTFKNLLPNCRKLKPPLDEKAIDRVDKLLKGRDVAALIMEPVILNLGVMIPDKAFMQGLRELCTKYGTLLILDEVATGFGRTGKLFATEHFEIEPDVMTLAKAITGGYAGMGATIVTEEIGEAVREDVSIYSTYGWHPLSVDAAIANLKFIKKNEKRLLGNVAKMSEYFATRLSQMEFKQKVTLNIMGLAIGIGLGDSDDASRLSDKCLKNGLLVTTEGSSLTLFPPLNIDKATAKEGLNILESCL
ncbi:MAG: aspartate aminotransferase family protein [Acidobacteria bacterium]|nr:aspartate aminotransferase family protein [Acidobacteriota bacterium]